MSHANNHIIKMWEVIEVQLRCHRFSYHHNPLSPRNNGVVQDALELWWLATYDSLRSADIPDHGILNQWVKTLLTLDIFDLASFLKDADDLLLHEKEGVISYDSFKHYLKKDYPFTGEILSPVKQIIGRWFLNRDTTAFSLFHSWLCFITRINLQDHAELRLKAENDFLANEKILMKDGFTSEESSLIASWFPRDLQLSRFYAEHFRPRHSNGSTADQGKNLVDKYLGLKSDYLTRFLWANQQIDYPLPPRMGDDIDRTARVQFVGKSLTSYRTISMEPVSLMWHQQGIFSAFVDDLKTRRHHPLKKRFQPDRQEPNRERAWEGSINGSFATIDLSSASDSVSWGLVRSWFSKSCLYPWLLTTRSKRALLPSGETIVVEKFAPMGSALNFPVECIVFAAITECAIKECDGDPVASRYQIYGDDIVVESEYASTVMRRLEQNGFTVNTGKSFCNTDGSWYFRESCGGHYLDGDDVTPTRLSRKFSGLTVSSRRPEQIENLLELANDCNSRYPSVRRRCICALNTLQPHLRVPFNSDGEGYLFSTTPTNWHLARPRWSVDYQEYFYQIGTRLDKHFPLDQQVEDIRLYEHLRQSEQRTSLVFPEDRVEVDLRRLKTSVWATKASYEDWGTICP